MNKEEIEELVAKVSKEAAKEAIRDMFLLMGVKLDDGNDILNMQKNFQHLQESREGKEEFIKRGKTAAMLVFITGTIGLIVKGFWAELASMFGGS